LKLGIDIAQLFIYRKFTFSSNPCSNTLKMVPKSKAIHKNNKYWKFEPNPLLYNKKT
jgi:hypothetical protein